MQVCVHVRRHSVNTTSSFKDAMNTTSSFKDTTHQPKGFTKRHLLGWFAVHLIASGQKGPLHFSHCRELGEVVSLVGINKVLNLGHLKLAHSQEPGAWGDLVPERLADLRCRKGQLAIVELQQSLEVDKNALGSLWSQEAEQVTENRTE